VTFSRRFAGIVGHDLGELEPSVAAWERLAHPDDRERAWAALRRHLAGETERHVVEMRLRHKDGRWLSVVVRGKVVARDESGQPLRMAGTVTDVTRNVETERALAASEERYRDLLERNPEGIVVLQDDKVVLANQAAARIAGFGSPEDFVGTGPQDRLDAANLLAVRGATLRALAGEVVRPFDIAFPMPDGGSRIVETTGASVQFAGRPAVQVLFRDVSELRAAQAQAQVASRLQALGTFVAGMAHEFNNPLAGALANDAVAVEMIREAQREVRRDGAMDRVRIDRDLDEVLASLEDSKAAMQRIALLVKDLVTFGRPDGGRTRVGLGEVLDQAVRSLATAQVDVPGLTVEKGETPEVEASFGQLTHLVIGLVANAARAIPRGRAGSVRVRIGNGHPGMARLEVSDDGVGMAPEVLARVFDPFFSTREVGQGLGMGLALAHAIVTDHGGTISARSEVGKGSTFIVDLPAAHPADAAAS
jgi:PAS domain S-box-containing protein